MSCERMGHSGAEDHHNQPKFRCLYCGSWGYESKWYDWEKEEYENCPCDYTYDGHFDLCEEPEPEVCDCGCNDEDKETSEDI